MTEALDHVALIVLSAAWVEAVSAVTGIATVVLVPVADQAIRYRVEEQCL